MNWTRSPSACFSFSWLARATGIVSTRPVHVVNARRVLAKAYLTVSGPPSRPHPSALRVRSAGRNRSRSMDTPIVRDFTSRARAVSHATPTLRPVSIDIEPNHHRHNTDLTRRGSLQSLQTISRRITRSNTIRNYHADVPIRPQWTEPGAEPGIDPLQEAISHFSVLQQPCQITVVDYSEDRMERYDFDNEAFIDFIAKPREDWAACRWINVNGLSWDVIKALTIDQKLHRLAIEDLLTTGGRTKADFYKDHAFSKSTFSPVFQSSVNAINVVVVVLKFEYFTAVHFATFELNLWTYSDLRAAVE